jgi:hypothetical protein
MEGVAGVFEFRTKLVEIINGSVEDHADLSVGREHGLASGVAEIENGQTPMGESRAGPGMESFGIGPPVCERLRHRPSGVFGGGSVGVDNTGDSTHAIFERLY